MIRIAFKFFLNIDLTRKILLTASIIISICKTLLDLVVISFFGLIVSKILNSSSAKSTVIEIPFLNNLELINFFNEKIFHIFIILIFLKFIIDFVRAYTVNYSSYNCWSFLNIKILNNIDKKCIPKKKLYAVESIILSENFDFVNTFSLTMLNK